MSFFIENNHIEMNPYKADCNNCFGLCCVALPFMESADFAFTKDAGTPCHHLQTDFRCGIHQRLRETGFRGCTVYECFGAGQKVSQHTYKGIDWRNNPLSANEMFQILPIIQQLHEMLYYLAEALQLGDTRPIRKELEDALNETERLTLLEPQAVLAIDVSAHRAIINPLLLKTSELVRNSVAQQVSGRQKHTIKRNVKSNMMGAKLKNADLRGMNLRGVFLIAADLRGADMRHTDLIGADLRDADLSSADLTGAIFLTQAQVNSAMGDSKTKLPPALDAPRHWLKSEY
ncbi:pentapeptide repeat-containing protein [Planococcus sp. N028]|uniref:Pentapeptide repeat-containing protein n=1 Tax=Planococcus shixiaomingii TaxID=3058393 RepID=A0ABT8MY51_9BACL|nr:MULTISPECIES: pentapeptide repeat-containing protein [unclassified Planococcus (in: firmicutes)]MDN7240561.1 pentapeptide repeat-containing protein [Planococcus sp. N028]WKA56451.1 pentapeptide repeat-containing protein [Planococcus sp. N022]